MKSRQVRISEPNYKILDVLIETLGVSRSEILNNAIRIIKRLSDEHATSVKIICDDGEEKELLLTLPLGTSNED